MMSVQCTSSATPVGVEAEALLSATIAMKLVHDLKARIVELAVALVLLEMGRVFRSQEGALMVIEPPGNVAESWSI